MTSRVDALQRPVFAAGGYKPFAEFTLADVESRAAELADVAGVGPLTRVAPVARAWRELGRALVAAGAGKVGELDEDVALEFARRVWVLPPSLL
jgi:hypothetical protein